VAVPLAPPPLPSKVERLQLGAQVGWVFDSSVDTLNGSLEVDQGLSYNFYGDITIRPGLLGELSYTWLPTHLDFDPLGGPEQQLTRLDVHYFQAGVQGEFLPGKVRPYMSVLLGATLFHPHATNIDDEWRFTMTLAGGVKYLPHPRFGLRAQARLLTTFSDVGSGLFCGVATTGAGACTTGFGGTGIVQFELSGGAFVTF
jgi:hypothetical protein